MIIPEIPSHKLPTEMQEMSTLESPPSYTAVASQETDSLLKRPQAVVLQASNDPVAVGVAGPSYYTGSTPVTNVYHYQNPLTGEQITSFLPPDHPQMICLQEGQHVRRTSYGLLGVLAAIFWFPLGVGICMLDRKIQCKRCGFMVRDGLC